MLALITALETPHALPSALYEINQPIAPGSCQSKSLILLGTYTYGTFLSIKGTLVDKLLKIVLSTYPRRVMVNVGE